MNKARLLLLASVLACGSQARPSDRFSIEGRLDDGVITLQQAIRMAIDRAPELAVARARAARAGDALREARSLNLPQVVTGTGLAYNNGFPLSLEGSAPSVVQVGVAQALLSKKNKNLILEARENQRASEIGTETSRQELAAKTALAYEELHQGRKLLDLCIARQDSASKQLQVTVALLEAGKIRPVDLTLARAVAANASQQLLVARERARLAESALRDALGLAGTPEIRTAEPRIGAQTLEPPPETLYRRALETHPEIQQAEAELRAKEFHVAAEKGEFLPRLDLVGQYALFSRFNNYQDFFNRFSRSNFLAGLSIQVPVFNGFRTDARVAQSRQEVLEARSRLERLKSDLKLGVERGVSEFLVARGAADLARLEAAAAQENLVVNQAQYDEGRIATRELESARAQLHEKEIAVIEAEKALWQRQVELLRLTGMISSLY